MCMKIVLNQRGKQSRANAKADRPCREINKALIFCSRRIGLCAAERAEIFQVLKRLMTQKILNGMEDGGGVGFDGDPVLCP